jgi:hypothetical protein
LGPNFCHDLVLHKHSPNRYKAAGGKYEVQNQTPIAKYFSLWNKTHKIYVQFSTHLSFKSLEHFLEEKMPLQVSFKNETSNNRKNGFNSENSFKTINTFYLLNYLLLLL